MLMKTFGEKERACELSFQKNGPFWHIYTDGGIMADIFTNEVEFREGMITLAVCATLYNKAELITFILMNNHIHFIMRGSREDCLELFHIFKLRLMRRWRDFGRPIDWTKFEAQILRIESLRALRNEIAYVHRNAYVANPNYSPFNYPWSGGVAYFTPIINLLPAISVRNLKTRVARDLTHYRDIMDLEGLYFVDKSPHIPSFCRIDIGESVFPDARHYFLISGRNAEAFSQIASRLKDIVFLTDDEIYVVAVKYSEEMFSQKLHLLSPEQRIELARKLHFEFNASNRTLRRILGLEIRVLDELFPRVSS